ncbi:MAG: hypothetical protein RLZZ621_1599 [Gemmatimonadota bacterium]
MATHVASYRLVARQAMRLAIVTAAITEPLSAQPRGGKGFLFQRPTATISIRGGAAQPSASGDIFRFVSKQLTVDRRDYLGAAVAADVAFALSNRVEIVASAATSARRINSEYRDFVDNSDLPIEQTTALRRTPLTMGVRYNLLPSGRSVSRYAWVPAPFTPYVAAGAGVVNYRFAQDGDFVDFKTNDVFNTSLSSSGWTSATYLAGGAQWNLNPNVALNTEVRYDQGQASLGRDFEGFRRMSLAGVGVTAGFTFRY